VRYAFIAKHRLIFSIRAMCRCLSVQPSGFYAWLKSPFSRRAQEDERQIDLIKDAWKASGKVYGYRKLHDDLMDMGETCCPNRAARLAQIAGVRARIGYKKRPGKYGGKPSLVVDNMLDRQFDVEVPDKAWVTDITYIRTHEGFAYLAVVLDLFSRRIVGWSMQGRQATNVVLQALLAAVWRRKPKNRVLVHSDQGSQFTSMEWASFLKHHNLEPSMSRRGNCHDNAVAESLFAARPFGSICSSASVSTGRSIGRGTMRGKTCSIISKCSTIQHGSTRGTVCCHPSSSNGSSKYKPRVSRKLGAIHILNSTIHLMSS
jgi:putative transposase